MPAATQGCTTSNATTPATVRSSPALTTTLLAGSGEELTARRSPAFTAWLASAITPPVVVGGFVS